MCVSRALLFATLWAIASKGPLSMGFSRQEYWSGFAVSFWKWSSRLRDGTCVSCTAGGFCFLFLFFFFICWVIKESQAKPWSKLIQDITKSFFSFLGPLIFHVLEEKEGIEFCLLWLIRLFFTQFMFQRWVSLIFLVWREKVSFTDEKTF